MVAMHVYGMDGRDAAAERVLAPELSAKMITAVERGDVDFVRAALAEGTVDIRSINKRGSTLLFFAGCKNAPERGEAMVDMLIQKGIDINTCNSFGKTALWFFCDSGQIGIVNKLIELKAAVDDDGVNDGTPLARAINKGHAELACALLAHKANPNIADKKGMTPLMWGGMREGGNPEVVAALIAHGADVMAENEHKQTAFRFAAHRGHDKVAQALLETGKVANFIAVGGSPLLARAYRHKSNQMLELIFLE